MRLGTTYISVNDFAKSLAFYQLLLEQEPLYCNDDRWATMATSTASTPSASSISAP